jgi:hypothetical protein
MVWWDLVEQVWQNGCISDAATCDLDCPYLQCLLINPYVYLAPQTTFGSAMLAGIPFSFALSFDACAVDKQVQRSG